MSPHVLRQEKVLKSLWDLPEGARIKELVRTIYPPEIWMETGQVREREPDDKARGPQDGGERREPARLHLGLTAGGSYRNQPSR